MNTKHLTQRVDRARAEREREKERTQAFRDRLRAIEDAPPRAVLGFWCDECRKDVVATGYKCIAEHDRDNPRAFYKGQCPKGHTVIRRITDKDGDAYYYKSEFVRKERMTMGDDLLQPHDPRFRVVYPDVWRRMQEQKDKDQMLKDYKRQYAK